MKKRNAAIIVIILTSLLLGSIFLFYSPVAEAGSPPTKSLFEYWNSGDDSAYQLTDNGRFMAQEFDVNAIETGSTDPYYITGVRLKMYRAGSPGAISISIYDNSGITDFYGAAEDDGALCTVYYDPDGSGMTTSTSGAWYWFNFTGYNQQGGTPLYHNTHYYIVVSNSGADTSNHVHWRDDGGSFGVPHYPGGGINAYYIWHGDLGGTVESTTSDANTLMFECYGINAASGNTERQTYYGVDGTDDTSEISFASASQWKAQTFTPANDFYLSGVEFLLYEYSTLTGTATISIRNTTAHLPSGTDWVSNSLSSANPYLRFYPLGDTHDRWMKANFSQTIHLIGGTEYAIVIRWSGSPYYLHARVNLGAGYAGGQACSSGNSGGTWSGIGSDMLFRTYGIDAVLPTSPSITINGTAAYVLARPVTLTLSCANALTMQFRNETSTWSVNQSYGTTKAWNLSVGYGAKNVSVRFWNANGSATAYDTIAYIQYLTSIGTPYPANASTGISLNPHMSVTLANHSVQTRLRLYMSQYGVGNYGTLWSPWVLAGNLTTNTNGVKYFNISTPLNANTEYAWCVEIQNTTSLASFFSPLFGLLVTPGDGVEEPLGTPHYSWVFTTTSIMANMTITHPVDNSVETEALWLTNHNLVFNVTSNTLGHNLSVYMTVKVRFKTGTYWETMDAVRVTPDPTIHPGITGIVTYDISDYIPYENAEYNITLQAYDWDHYGASIDDPAWRSVAISNANASMNFTLVSPVTAAKNQRFAISACDPADKYVNGVDAVSYGFRCKVAVNITDADPQFWFFICDGEDSDVLTYGSRTATDCHSISYAFGNGMFEPRKKYMVAIGVMWSGTKPGDCKDWGTPPLSLSQYDSFYDDTALFVGNFSYEWMNWDIPKTFRLFSGYGSGDTTFYGYRIMFDTYPVGESPPSTPGTSTGADNSLGSQWGQQNIGQLETNTGIAGLMIIAGLIIVALFSIMPYLIIKKKGQNVPTPIFAFFGLFGAVLSYGMGLFPLWFFILPTFFCIFIIIYKVSGWVLANKELVTAEGKK